MDWARILAYVTGTVDQELLARYGYLAAGPAPNVIRPWNLFAERLHHSRWNSPALKK